MLSGFAERFCLRFLSSRVRGPAAVPAHRPTRLAGRGKTRSAFPHRWYLSLWLTLAAAIAPGASAAADAQGQFALKGVAVLSCRQFVDARAAGAELELRFRNWIDGYLTAVNDAAPWGTGEVLAVIIENHCRQSPEESFASAMQRLVLTMKEDRLIQGSPLRTVFGKTVSDKACSWLTHQRHKVSHVRGWLG